MQETLIKKTKRKEKHNKGITLIALVVTIIILLILAGVTIMTLLGDNGIINKTSGAKQLTEQKGVEEQILLAVAASMANDKAVVQESLLRTALENSFGTEASGGYTLTGSDSAGWTIVAKGITYKVDSHGNEIKEVPKVNPADVTPVAISKLTTNIDTTVVDTNGYTLNNTKVTDATTETAQTLWVPKDFKIKTGTDPITNQSYPTTVADGIVVEDKSGNQFVWVPVPVAIWDSTKHTADELGYIQGGKNYTPMAVADSTCLNPTVSGTLYRGLLYTFSGTTATYQSGYKVGEPNFREPSLVTGDSSVMWAPMAIEQGQTDVADCAYDYDRENLAKAGSFETASAFGTQMQRDYNEMITSVDKYGGFYVGRFETGYKLDDSTKIPTSKPETNDNGVTTADATENKGYTWYGLYKMQKEFATTSEKVKSSMIWGSQYDAMMNWMAKTGKEVGTSSNNRNTKQTTGSKKEDIINNVFDLYGCHYEWTLEAYRTDYRAIRGGEYDHSRAPAERHDYHPTYAGDYSGSRLTLYIVE